MSPADRERRKGEGRTEKEREREREREREKELEKCRASTSFRWFDSNEEDVLARRRASL